MLLLLLPGFEVLLLLLLIMLEDGSVSAFVLVLDEEDGLAVDSSSWEAHTLP